MKYIKKIPMTGNHAEANGAGPIGLSDGPVLGPTDAHTHALAEGENRLATDAAFNSRPGETGKPHAGKVFSTPCLPQHAD